MFFVFVELFGLTALSLAQEPRYAAILTDARYLAGDGTFGAAYTQEDGVEFKEISDADGDRRGSYSYVDPTGHRRTVQYTAGKNGFQPIGEGIPKVTVPTPPPLNYELLPEYNSPQYQSQSDSHAQSQPPSSPKSYQYQTEAQYVQESVHQLGSTYQSGSARASQQTHRPRYQNEYEVSEYQPQAVLPPVPPRQRILASYNRPQLLRQYQSRTHKSHSPRSQYGPAIEYFLNTPSESTYGVDRSGYDDSTTPSPQRYYPSGKLDFTRTPDGFSYTFIKS